MDSYDDIALPPRILCISGHVIHGYVGNRAAVFPLQVLGFEVDVLNTCQGSNHFDYTSSVGHDTSAEQMDELVGGLAANGLLVYDYVFTGYIANAALLASVAKLLALLKQANPAVRYICDPVLGDHGKMYVPDDMVDSVRRLVLPLAHTVTPIHCEAEWLTGLQITSLVDIPPVLAALHALGPKVVALNAIAVAEHPNQLLSVVSEAVDGAGAPTVVTTVAFDTFGNVKGPGIAAADGTHFAPRLDGFYASLFLAWYHHLGDGHGGAAMSRAQSTAQQVLRVTKALAAKRAAAAGMDVTKCEPAQFYELALIPCRKIIAEPGPDVFITKL
jgi:hydroxymethylpyrimidine/phosphomethylpyrimidine kinase